MNESLLHYLLRFQKLSKSDLQTVDGQSLEILFPGYLNTLAGPDFSQAKNIFRSIVLGWCRGASYECFRLVSAWASK